MWGRGAVCSRRAGGGVTAPPPLPRLHNPAFPHTMPGKGAFSANKFSMQFSRGLFAPRQHKPGQDMLQGCVAVAMLHVPRKRNNSGADIFKAYLAPSKSPRKRLKGFLGPLNSSFSWQEMICPMPIADKINAARNWFYKLLVRMNC